MKADNFPPSSVNQSHRRLRRNPRRGRLGGVCAGIADRFGLSVAVVRFLFVLSLLFTGTLSFLIYLILWFVLPREPEVPIPDLPWKLGRELRRMDRQVNRAQRRLDPNLADLAQETFDAIKVLAPYFDNTSGAAISQEVQEAALSRFPKLVERLLTMPGEVLVAELRALHEQLQRTCNELIGREFRTSWDEPAGASPDLKAWKEQLAPLLDRLRLQAGTATLATLRNIEEKLGFLLQRLGENNALFDLNPFEVRKIAFDYLPDALNQYLALPSSMAQSQRLLSGKTAEESLNEQLGLLDSALDDLARSVFQKDAQGLVVHGRFLKEKFAEQPFRLAE